MKIRRYQAEDAEHIAAIFVAAVTVLGPRGYSPDQVTAWASRRTSPAETHARCSDGRLVLVAADHHDTPVAFIDLEDDGLIDMMFCRPEHAGRGIVSAMYRRIEANAVPRGMTRLHTEASELARPIFAHWGFRLLHRNDMEIEGVAIHNYAMEKPL